MTVLACSLTEMAADSLVTAGTAHWFATKLFRLKDGSIAGVAGSGGENLVAWLDRGSPTDDKPSLDGDFFVLRLSDAGIEVFCNSLIPDRLKADNYAVGSGGSVALYAMRKHGASPVNACHAAIEVNHFCGGEVDVMRL